MVSVTKKGHATIPKDLREKYGVEDKVLIVETEEGILFRALPRPRDKYGSLKELLPRKTPKEVLEEARDEELSMG